MIPAKQHVPRQIYYTRDIFWFSPFSKALFLSNHQSKSVLNSHFNFECSEAERIYKRGYQYKRREPDHIFLRWKKVGVLFFGSSVSFVKSGNAVNCTLHGNASDVDNCFPAHTCHHLMAPNITKYLMTQNIAGIITHLCF